MMKQLSYAKPTRNRHKQNDQKLLANAVPTPAKNPAMFVPRMFFFNILNWTWKIT